MNIKKIIPFLIIGFSLVSFSGCSNKPNSLQSHKIEEVDQILENFNLYSDFDTTYRIEGGAYLARMQIITKTVDNNPRFMIYTYERLGTDMSYSSVYLYNNYIYANQNSTNEPLIYEYNEAESPVTTTTPVPTTFDFEQINYTLNYVEDLETEKYEIIINDNSFQSLIEELLGDPLVGFTINCSMEVVADKETKNLESLKIIIQMKEGTNSPIIVTSTLTVNALGESVNLNFPSYVTTTIDDYIQYKPIYIDTIDNVVKFHKIGSFSEIIFDKKSNTFIALRDNRLDVYDATNMQFIQSFSDFPAEVADIDVDEGKLVVCYGMEEFTVFDLLDFSERRIIQVSNSVKGIKVDDDIVIYYKPNNHSILGFYDINLNTKWYYNSVMGVDYPHVDINREDHIVYVGEKNQYANKGNIIAVDVKNGKRIWIKTFSLENNNEKGLLYDGKYLHFRGKTFNSDNGALISKTLLSHDYTEVSGFIPYRTLYDSNKFSIVGHIDNTGRIGIYNYATQSFVYRFSMNHNIVLKLSENRYLVSNQTDGIFAIVDISKIDESIAGTDTLPPTNGITLSADGHVKTLKTTRFSKQVVDDDFIYTLDIENGSLLVYDIETLELVRTETFENIPNSISVDHYKVALGFDGANEIIFFNTITWEKSVIPLSQPARNVILYENKIFFIENKYIFSLDHAQFAVLKSYDIDMNEISVVIESVVNANIEINRNDCFLYVKSGYYIVYCNLTTMTFSDQIPLASRDFAFFDGYYVHVGNLVLDKITGEIMYDNIIGYSISDNTASYIYTGTDNWQMISTKYDDNNLSVFTASSDRPFTTVVYDVSTNEHLYTCYGRVSAVYKSGEKIILVNGLTGTISLLIL